MATMIGCAGWAIASRFAADFPGPGTHLERYAAVFNAVEINSSFYRSHRRQTYEKWRHSVPGEFRFCVKIPRSITHFQRLHDTENLLSQFAEESSGLQEKLGCILVQLPPSLHFEESIAAKFFTLARRHFSCQIACEARHNTWFGAAASSLLVEAAVTRVIADPAKGQEGAHVATTADGYRRLHGSPIIYRSAYEPAYLAQLAEELANQSQSGDRQWCIFDNTAEGAATSDALSLKSMLTNLLRTHAAQAKRDQSGT